MGRLVLNVTRYVPFLLAKPLEVPDHVSAYTMFNVYLPKLLEGRPGVGGDASGPKSLNDSLWDVVIYSVGGCPGAIVRLIIN